VLIELAVLGTSTRAFKIVFAQAQTQLRAVFGMEMAELPMREKVTLQQKRAAAKSQSQQKTSSAWIVVSTLPLKYKSPDILPPPQARTADTEAQYTALYTFIVSCILLSGGTLADSRLDRYLSRANVNEVTPFSNSIALGAFDKTEKLLKRMEKDGYIVKIRDNSGGDETVDWIVGPRGKVEIGESGVRGMVQQVYGEVDDGEELERKLQRSLAVLETRQQADGPEKKKRGRKAKDGNDENEPVDGQDESDEDG